MADVKKLAPIISKWEGGYVNDPTDKGGATNMGITIGTWKQIGYDKNGDGKIDEKDIKLLIPSDFYPVLKQYWNRWQADNIINQSIANILVDWVWLSGKYGIINIQEMLGLTPDGVVGPKTLSIINNSGQKELFDKIMAVRKQFIENIIKRNIIEYERKIGRKSNQNEKLRYTYERFRDGWINRLNDFKFQE